MKNNHARTKEKRKKLRLKAFQLRTWINGALRKMKAGNIEDVYPKQMIAANMLHARQQFDMMKRIGRAEPAGRNQRQRRKLYAQNPHLRNK